MKVTWPYIVHSLILTVVTLYSPPSHALDGPAILEKIKQFYATVETYKDSGTVIERNSKVDFRTFYQKPDLFFMEWTEEYKVHKAAKIKRLWRRSFVQSNSESTFIHLNYRGTMRESIERHSHLKDALYQAVAGTFGASVRVPSLFLKSLKVWRITDIENPKLVGIEDVFGKPCFHISGRNTRIDTLDQIWIETDTFIVRKYFSGDRYQCLYEEVTINKPIPVGSFVINPE